MLTIYTNENNPATWKLLISAYYGKKDVIIKPVNTKDARPSNYFPYLEIDSDNILFIPNTAASFLFPPDKQYDNEVDEWLEWELVILSPSIAHAIGSSVKAAPLKLQLQICLETLNNHLISKKYVIGETITVCDVAIWSTLYPLCSHEALSNEFLNNHSNIISWVRNLSSLPEFKKGLEEFKIVPGHAAYQALLQGARYRTATLSVTSNTTSSDTSNPTPDSPQKISVSNEELEAAKEAWDNGLRRIPLPKKEVNPVLPVAGQKNILITSALPYVNNVPHLGNIIGCVLSADVFARYCRMCNYNTLFVCGTDEYGTATETKALEEGLTPQQICDKYFEVHNSIYRWFNIGFDYFGRTTTPEQTKLCQEMFLVLNENGFMQVQNVDQLLCENCNRYLADRFVEGGCPHPGCTYEDARGDQCDGCGKLVNAVELKNPRCKVCRKSPVLRKSPQFFIDLPKLEPLLHHWMEKSSPGWSNNARLIAKSWMKEGLKPRCITRDLKWGVPVPLDGYRDKVFYVWFDAPLGYMSITERYTKEWEKWWRPAADTTVSLYQFMAKDNVPFHSVMFPATLLGANRGYTKVSHIMATEYLNYEDGKFSKSRGVGVFGNDAQNTGIPSDIWRFYLLYVRPESQDSSFSWVDLATKNNSELLNNLGNFVNRALVFCEKNFDSTVPEMKLTEEEYTLLALCTRELKEYVSCLNKAKLRDGIRFILAISRHGNQYMQSTQPWVLLKKSEEEKERAATIIGMCCNITYLLATLLFPYMPATSRTIQDQLNASTNARIISPEKPEIAVCLNAGHKIGKPAPLFTKIDLDKVEDLKKRFGGKQSDNKTAQEFTTLENEISKQADKVRLLKSSATDKSSWQPEVKILLDLKKKLETLKKESQNTPAANGSSVKSPDASKLEQEIEEQGKLVRQLKTSGASKQEWQPQVDILLSLKNKLNTLTGVAPEKGKKGKK